jgi:hypothetical protein
MSDTTAPVRISADPPTPYVPHKRKRTRSPNGQPRTREDVRVGGTTRDLLARRQVDDDLDRSELHRRALVYGLMHMPRGWPDNTD